MLHIHANTTEEGSSDHVEVGIDLTEYYINVEWDILRVPAERHVKVYACCPEPYPGTYKFLFVRPELGQFILMVRVICELLGEESIILNCPHS